MPDRLHPALDGRGPARGQGTIARSALRRWLVALVALLAVVAVSALLAPVEAMDEAALQIGVYDAPAQTPPSAIVDGLSASAFKPIEPEPLTLPGDGARHHWLRIRTELPQISDPTDQWVLRLDHAGVDAMTLYWPVATGLPHSRTVDFYYPRGTPPELAGGYAIALPHGLHGPVTMYLEVASGAQVSLSPHIAPRSDMIAAERHDLKMFSAIYTGLILLGLTGIAMFATLRDRVYLYFVAYVAALTLFVLAQNGHLYFVPALSSLQPLRSLGPSMLRCLLAAAIIGLMRPLLGLANGARRFDQLMRWAPLLPIAIAVVCVSGLPVLERPLQFLSCVVLVLAAGLCVAACAVAIRLRRHLAMPLLLMWVLLLAVSLLRIGVPLGWVPSNDLTLYSAQMAGALSAFLLSIAMADRIIEFREQRDRARQAQVQADNSLRIEQERRKFVEALHMGLRRAATGDQDWLAYRRLLDAMRLLIPQAGCVVAAYHQPKDNLLVCHPQESKDRYNALMFKRGVAFKGICRSQLPMQLHIDQPAADGIEMIDSQFAVLPLPLALPAWGVLLIERTGDDVFTLEELQLAREFAEKAAMASEEAANSRALRHSAEFDALTGAFNRRAVDFHLDKAFETARGRNTPMSVLFVDLDHLKDINDKFGHAVGDRCLRLLAETLSSRCGNADTFGRFGGDEFVVVLAGAGPDQARHWADGLLEASRQLGIDCPEGFAQLSTSIGVASRVHADKSVKDIVERADKALYAAKRLGRNRVQAFETLGNARLPEITGQ